MATATATPPTSSKTSEFCTVILDTGKMPATPGGAIAGPITYKGYADLSAKGKANPKIESVSLVPGHNFGVPREKVELLRQVEQAQKHIRKGVLTIIEPDNLVDDIPETGYSLDYSEEQALELIAQAEDLVWLKESQASERRKVVRDAIAAQVTILEEEMETLRAQYEGS